MLNLDAVVKLFDGVFIERVNDDEVFALNVTTGIFASIDDMSLLILQYIKEAHSIRDIINTIKAEYDCEEDIENDIVEFIKKAIESKFVEQL